MRMARTVSVARPRRRSFAVPLVPPSPECRRRETFGVQTSLHRYDTTALGTSEVTLLELANAYRMMASGIPAEPYVIAKIERSGGGGHLQPRLAFTDD